jgi:hypothetical protein
MSLAIIPFGFSRRCTVTDTVREVADFLGLHYARLATGLRYKKR